MAQKAAKTLRTRNTAQLTRLHLTSLALHTLFILTRFLLFRSSATYTSYTLYILLCLPAWLIEIWFEAIGRPSATKSGEDLEAKGLTEFLWDVVYWTWGCVGLVAVLGDWAWWAWAVVPLYSAWAAYTTFMGVRGGMGGLMGAGGEAEGMGVGGAGGESKRQKKLEKRGGQKMMYR